MSSSLGQHPCIFWNQWLCVTLTKSCSVCLAYIRLSSKNVLLFTFQGLIYVYIILLTMLAYSWNSHFLHNILAYLGTTAKNTTNTSNKYILVKSKVREATSLIIVMKTPYGRCEMPLDKQWVKTMLGPRLLMRSTFFDRLSPGMCK